MRQHILMYLCHVDEFVLVSIDVLAVPSGLKSTNWKNGGSVLWNTWGCGSDDGCA